LLLILVFLGMKENYQSAFSWDVAYAIPCSPHDRRPCHQPATLISRALASPPMVLLGEASYALYLVHVPAKPLLLATTTAGPAASAMLYFLCVGMVIALAVGLHITVEKPARRWLRAC
jgi:peptidoglycan/LPS O-acetylase OafA/YrhL